jgi:YaiO family outer membrane protein
VQPSTEAPNNNSNQTPPSGEIDVSGGYSSDGYQNWSGPGVHASFSPRNSFNRWNAGTARVQQFGETGQTYDGGIDRDLSNTWAGTLSISGSSAFFLPQLAVDVSASKRWFDSKKVVTTFSGSYVRWQDVHRDYHWGLGASYHGKRPWGVDGGVNIDLSTPTNQVTETQYFGVTYGSAKKRLVGLRGDFGRVSYQIIGPTTSISNFESYGISLQLRQWVSGSSGFFVAGSYSYNSVYQSEGITMGFFKEFSGSRQSPKQSSGR